MAFLQRDETFSENSDAVLDSPGSFRSKREAGWDGDLKPCNFSDRVFTAKLFSNVSRLAAEKLSDTRSLPLEVHVVRTDIHTGAIHYYAYVEHWQLHKWPLNEKYESTVLFRHFYTAHCWNQSRSYVFTHLIFINPLYLAFTAFTLHR